MRGTKGRWRTVPGTDTAAHEESEISGACLRFNEAMEGWEIGAIQSLFTDNCEVRFANIRLEGKEGVRRWIEWLHKSVRKVKFEPVTIMTEGNTLFQEFIVKAKMRNNKEVESRQAEVMVFEGGRIKSLRVYLDRLDFAEGLTGILIGPAVVRLVRELSTMGLS
jgi:ketosteroid isomerase-like protein